MDSEIKKIPIYMHPLLTAECEEQIQLEEDSDPFRNSPLKYEYYGPRAQWLLSAVLSSLGLNRYDEIAILTTSNETYVTICVSIPAFNYAKISRVVTEKTKVVIVIHEFGYVFPDIEIKTREWQSQGIVVIEDCAHIIGAEVNGKTVGSFGDYALFSLTKVIPGRAGGLLRTNRRLKLPMMDQEQLDLTKIGIAAAKLYLSKYSFFNTYRIRNSELLREKLQPYINIFEPSPIAVPYFLGIIVQDKKKTQLSAPYIEWGATLRNDLLYVPTNPLVTITHYITLTEVIK